MADHARAAQPSFQPTRRTGLNRTVLSGPGQPWHGQRAGRALGATSSLSDEDWLNALTCLLRTLTDPSPQDKEARPDWGEQDWARWSAVERVVLCGGVLLGRPSPRPVAGLEVSAARRPAEAPLTGLATLPRLTGAALLLDLGHSAVKAAVARPVAVGRPRLGPVLRVPVPWTPFDTQTWPDEERMLDVIHEAACLAVAADALPDDTDGVVASTDTPPAGTCSAEPGRPLTEVRVAIANYVVDGRLDEDQTYGRLARIDPDPRRLLATTLAPLLGPSAEVVTLVNDGAAAALAWADQPGTAVISIGTSLGVGFAPGRA